MRARPTLGLSALAAALAVACAGAAGLPGTQQTEPRLKASFRRPTVLPAPPDNLPTAARVALGRRLFSEPRLSADDTISCASCHNPALSFTDGVAIGKGIAKTALARHTPSLWNAAWIPALFWDGRAGTLEEQAVGPIEHPKEMGQPIVRGVEKLWADPSYPPAFATAFPNTPQITASTITRALASFERTLVSPATRFDRWIEGDGTALSPAEISGFQLFTGKAGCVSCHTGWNFTDQGFHDIGLPGGDLGRGPIADLPRANQAFKTPSLRELVWTAPYMHDGSIATLDDVVRHYEAGGVARETRSPDLPAGLTLDDTERDNLVAFLESLSSERPPKPATDLRLAAGDAATAARPMVDTLAVTQKDKAFWPVRVALRRGQALTVSNTDTRPHNVRVFDPRLKFNSGVQEPGESTSVTFDEAGSFEVFCGIHPSMRLTVEVK